MAARASFDSERSQFGEETALQDTKYSAELSEDAEIHPFRAKKQQKRKRYLTIGLVLLAVGGFVSLILQILIFLKLGPGFFIYAKPGCVQTGYPQPRPQLV